MIFLFSWKVALSSMVARKHLGVPTNVNLTTSLPIIIVWFLVWTRIRFKVNLSPLFST